jgi:hypothetical protein
MTRFSALSIDTRRIMSSIAPSMLNIYSLRLRTIMRMFPRPVTLNRLRAASQQASGPS